MAKIRLEGFIHSIWGSVGGVTFYRYRGRICMRKKSSRRSYPNTSVQCRAKEGFSRLSHLWNELSFVEWALWSEYAKSSCKAKDSRNSGLIPCVGGVDGRRAFISANQLLLRSGLGIVRHPPLGKEPPPYPLTDLSNFGSYNVGLRFNVWLPYPYKDECVAQVWLRRTIGDLRYSYISVVVPVSTTPNEVKIDKVRARHKNKLMEEGFSDIKRCRLKLQLRTVAENGRVSHPGSIYQVEVSE